MRWFTGWRRNHRLNHFGREAVFQCSWLRAPAIALATLACLAVAACGTASAPTLNLPGGTFTSATYGFHITYPRNWLANPSEATAPSDGSTDPIPFTLTITRTGDAHSAAALVSTCAITVMNLKNSDIAKSAKGLATNSTLQAMTIGGAAGYVSAPLVQDIPNSEISVTHTDYYVVHGGYEYQISTDSVKGDNADGDLRSMVQSFGFGG
jgi:hypothetical protein